MLEIIIPFSVVLLCVITICICVYNCSVNEAKHEADLLRARLRSAEALMDAKTCEFKRVQSLLEKLLEKNPTINVDTKSK